MTRPDPRPSPVLDPPFRIVPAPEPPPVAVEGEEPMPRPMAPLVAPSPAPPPHHRATVASVCELARRWRAGDLPLREVAKISTGYERWVAAYHVRPDHPDFRALRSLQEALVDGNDRFFVAANGQTFDLDAALGQEARLLNEGGRDVLAFPCLHPWRRKPNRDTGEPGERAPALYRRPEERGPGSRAFDTAPAPRPEYRPGDWWEVER